LETPAAQATWQQKKKDLKVKDENSPLASSRQGGWWSLSKLAAPGRGIQGEKAVAGRGNA